jgi:hypothetical protein
MPGRPQLLQQQTRRVALESNVVVLEQDQVRSGGGEASVACRAGTRIPREPKHADLRPECPH